MYNKNLFFFRLSFSRQTDENLSIFRLRACSSVRFSVKTQLVQLSAIAPIPNGLENVQIYIYIYSVLPISRSALPSHRQPVTYHVAPFIFYDFPKCSFLRDSSPFVPVTLRFVLFYLWTVYISFTFHTRTTLRVYFHENFPWRRSSKRSFCSPTRRVRHPFAVRPSIVLSLIPR